MPASPTGPPQDHANEKPRSGTVGSRSPSLNAELIALRIGKHHPSTRLLISPVVDNPGPQGNKALDLRGLFPAIRHDVKVHAVLDDLRLRHADEDKPRQSSIRWADHPEPVTGRIDLFDRITGDRAPETGDGLRVAAVERDVQYGGRHDPASGYVRVPRYDGIA